MAMNLIDSPFQYQRLEDARTQIRVLKIRPGTGDLIETSLTHAKLQKGSHSCLSYCWGTAAATHKILVNQRVFLVRPSLYDFLSTAQARGIIDTLWIDAICINQTDNNEKAVQVELMGEIYSLATKTFVHLSVPLTKVNEVFNLRNMVANSTLGQEEFDNSDFKLRIRYMISALNNFGNALRRRIFEFTERDVDDMDTFFGHDDLDFMLRWTELAKSSSQNSDGLNTVFMSLYWTRAWINQEIILSEDLQIITSHGELRAAEVMELNDVVDLIKENLFQLLSPFKMDIAAVTTFFQICGYPKVSYVSQLQHSNLLRGLLAIPKQELAQGMSLDKALLLTRENGCFYARDRIFSIRSLLREDQKMNVDYSASHESILYDLLQIAVRSDRDMHIVHVIGRLAVEALEMEPVALDVRIDTTEALQNALHTDDTRWNLQWAAWRDETMQSGEDDEVRDFALYVRLTHPTGHLCVMEYPVVLAHDKVFRWYDLEGRRGNKARVWIWMNGKWKTCQCVYSATVPPRLDRFRSVDEDCCFAKIS